MDLNKILCQLFIEPTNGNQLGPKEWAVIILVLRQQQLLARFSYRWRNEGIFNLLPDYTKHHFRNAEILAEKQHRQVAFEATELIHFLSGLHITPIFLKGAAYALTNNLGLGLGRTFSDIDILVPKESIELVEQKLKIFGYFGEPLTSYDENYYRSWTHEVPPLRHHARGTIIDIHHNLIPPVSGRAPDMKVFMRHIVKTAEGFCTLDLSAMTLHSIIHLFINEDFKNAFRDLTDLHLLFEDFSDDDWRKLVELSIETGFTLELILATRYCHLLLTTNIPSLVFNELEKYKPAKLRMLLLDFIFMRTLVPKHPLTGSPSQKVAVFFAFVRGHFLKMPFHILLGHLTMKSFFWLRDALFGKHQFSPKRPG